MIFGKILPFLRSGKNENNILLTGIPRSGTTLACRLLCNYAETVALNEPMDKNQFENPKAAEENISEHFRKFRKSLLKNGTAVARTEDGKLTDNAYSQGHAQRERVIERSPVHFDKALGHDFTLIMKHCAEFTLLLPELSKQIPIYAMIRNPLAILASWASVDVPVSRGKVAKSAQLNPDFNAALNKQGEDLLRRQLFILSWYFGQYNDFNQDRIIRYEDMIDAPDLTLNSLGKGKLLEPFQNLKNKNSSELYDKTHVIKAGNELLNSEGNYWRYYLREDVSQVLEKIKGNGQ